MSLLEDYIDLAMSHAIYELINDPRPHFATIPGFQGLWANGATLEECKLELEEILIECIYFDLKDGRPIPQYEAVHAITLESFPQVLIRELEKPSPAEEEDNAGDDVMISEALLREILKEAGISEEEWEAL